jgi:hypothetical protein
MVALRREDVQAIAAWDFGPVLAVGHLWRELSLEATLDRLVRRSRGDAAPPLSDRALVLVTNRLTAPASEHGLARWPETDFVCDRDGRRWVPAWRDDRQRVSSKTPRVRVEIRQLKQWYRTLDQLLAHKSHIEHAFHAGKRHRIAAMSAPTAGNTKASAGNRISDRSTSTPSGIPATRCNARFLHAVMTSFIAHARRLGLAVSVSMIFAPLAKRHCSTTGSRRRQAVRPRSGDPAQGL